MTSRRTSGKGHAFTVVGSCVKSLRKQLKRGTPKKRDFATAVVIIEVGTNSATFALPGACATVSATSKTSFSAQVPYAMFRSVWLVDYPDDAVVHWAIGPGSFTVDGVRMERDDIIVERGGPNAPPPAAEPKPSLPTIPGALENCLGLPHIAAYRHIRAYGLRLDMGNESFIRQQREVEQLLDAAQKLLRPLGITRGDLELLLDRKLGEL